MDSNAEIACGQIEMDEEPCSACDGSGEVPILRDTRGALDFLDGKPDGWMMRCDRCKGEGVEP